MILSFKTNAASLIRKGRFSSRLPSQIQAIARRKLRMIDAAQCLNDLRVPPDSRLEALTGGRTGQWSVRVNDQWRVCFEWEDRYALNVEICDYH
ncbi:MAG: type II toxin-antitoxin system RelE/ParE family toxin [Candidatus Accumulibacter sp.]|jgi:proteic killer suppression protein|nr:type II toxin-antitoxin system RelE/ParE family toxin [Accumulibacter sp.]